MRCLSAHSRYLARRTLLLKSFVLLYTVFNSQIGFPGVLDAMAGGDGPCTIPFILRYINAQPLLTSCVVTMVCTCTIRARQKFPCHMCIVKSTGAPYSQSRAKLHCRAQHNVYF